MDKLKQVMSRHKDEPEVTQSTTGKVSGQGSHFASAKQPSATYTGTDTLGSTTAGTESQTAGPVDTSAVTPDPNLAKDTQGPEAGGQSHIGTSSPEAAGKTASAPGYDAPAAVGTTSTYSTTHLTKGDPTPSVIDPGSIDPVTYQKPEVASSGRDTGVPEGAAQTAATRAFSGTAHDEGMPGAYPTSGYENPYKASNLDSRVEGLPSRREEEAPASAASHTVGSSTAEAGAAGLATAGAVTAVHEHDKLRETTGPASSTLASTTPPADRLAEYSQADKTKVPEAAAATAMSPQTSAGSQPQEQPSIVDKVLGAVGLGSLAGAGAAAATKSRDDSAVDTSEGPVTTTGTDSYRSPSQSGPPPSHHRKESIPTTAYPAGPDSARPIAPPIGGTRQSTEQVGKRPEDESHLGRDAVLGAGVVGAAGAGAVGAHEYEKSRALGRDTTGQPGTVPGATSTTTSVPAQQYNDSKEFGGGYTGHQATTTTGAATSERDSALAQGEEKEDHTKRNAALTGVAGVGAAGAGAFAAEEYSKDHAEKEAARKAAEHEKEMAHQRKEIEKQQAAQAKEAEKEQRAAEKQAAKEEKAHEKELEKKEKAAAKEQKKAEKDAEKEQIAAAAAAEKQRKQREEQQAAAEKERLRQEEQEKRRREEELAAAGVGAGAAGAGVAAEKHDKAGARDTAKEGEPSEKKPSLLKRIFKRKNKDTGEDEEYEAEQEEKDDSHKGAAAAGVAGAGAAGTATYAITHDEETGAPQMQPVEDHPTTKYEEQAGGFQKPSYNPFKKDRPDVSGTADINNEGRTGETMPYDAKQESVPTPGPAESGTTTVGSAAANDKAYESVEDKQDRNRLHKDPPADHPAAVATTAGEERDSGPGLPYDASKDPDTAAKLGEHEHGATMGEGTSTAKKFEPEEQGEEHKGLRQKMKEKLGLAHPESDHSK